MRDLLAMFQVNRFSLFLRYGHDLKNPAKAKNPRIQRFTYYIKHLATLLVNHERVITTRSSAKTLAVYGNLLIDLCNRKESPPDLERIQNGFLLSEQEVRYNLRTVILKHGRKKRWYVLPDELEPQEFRNRCEEEIRNILLGNDEVISKLKTVLAPRFSNHYGDYAKVKLFPDMGAEIRPHFAMTYYLSKDEL